MPAVSLISISAVHIPQVRPQPRRSDFFFLFFWDDSDCLTHFSAFGDHCALQRPFLQPVCCMSITCTVILWHLPNNLRSCTSAAVPRPPRCRTRGPFGKQALMGSVPEGRREPESWASSGDTHTALRAIRWSGGDTWMSSWITSQILGIRSEWRKASVTTRAKLSQKQSISDTRTAAFLLHATEVYWRQTFWSCSKHHQVRVFEKHFSSLFCYSCAPTWCVYNYSPSKGDD